MPEVVSIVVDLVVEMTFLGSIRFREVVFPDSRKTTTHLTRSTPITSQSSLKEPAAGR